MVASDRITNASFEVRARWGSALDDGFVVVPNVLLRKQVQLGLNPSEVVTLLNVLSFWWKADALPFPGAAVLAKRMGTTPRTIERNLNGLVEKGLIKKVNLEGKRHYDPSNLVALLKEYAEESQNKRGSKATPAESAKTPG